jgi:hypothetical protein
MYPEKNKALIITGSSGLTKVQWEYPKGRVRDYIEEEPKNTTAPKIATKEIVDGL